jgi:hypothetical protein
VINPPNNEIGPYFAQSPNRIATITSFVTFLSTLLETCRVKASVPLAVSTES